MARVWHLIEHGWLSQRGALFPWVPVWLGCGVGFYFALRVEPSALLLWACGAGAVMLGLLSLRGREWAGPLLLLCALVLAGVAVAGARAHLVAGPVLGWRYYGPVEGRIVAIDRSASDALRLTLDHVVLDRMDPARVPDRVRVSLHGDQGFVTPRPGLRVMLTGHLSPPSGPVEPGGFDFRRHAWFLGIGAVGYTRTPVLTVAEAQGAQALFKARMALSTHVQARLPGQVGAFAAAIMTGDRAGLSQDTLQAMRISNLAHLLAISGLHMGLLAGFVFAACRLGLAALPGLGLRWPIKKIAAGVAILAGAGYLGLSGGNVATERAFVMVAVMLVAVMLDRRALSLRAVAVAAVIVLCLQPEALLGPGFQMSFAATVALVAVFGWLRDARVPLGPRWLRPALAVVISSAVAGAATAPVAAAHFNQIAQYGLLANLMSVPLMGVLVMPAAVVAALLLPLGLDWVPLWAMGQGLEWILGVATRVSSWEGARGLVVTPGPMVLPLVALGALFLVLWQGRARLAGLVPVVFGFWLWSGAERPTVLVSDNGGLVGVLTPEGRALNKPRGGGFVALNWLENDGDAATQEAAHARWPGDMPLEQSLRVVTGARAARDITDCGTASLVVFTAEPETLTRDIGCRTITPTSLFETGSLAIYDEPADLLIVTARSVTGTRLWSGQ
ncbi:ComEC family competence protein [Roseovarius sp. A-2]|uniref:ComEC/Rec2 family competence protein n=1 Tax=Roseovarius sp. A-2 TaxID=1570360 RepID=UPI0009B54E37|nr:ComEC/Rec2 family competence protein [Roseovarius sp. A-2]GAW34826.1 ComEC family competence protein [Roseovarius sp. A-2]